MGMGAANDPAYDRADGRRGGRLFRGGAVCGLDSSRSYDDHSYFPEGWSTHGKAVANFRNMAFRMGLKLLQKNGRVVMRLPERKPLAANGKIHSRRVSDV